MFLYIVFQLFQCYLKVLTNKASSLSLDKVSELLHPTNCIDASQITDILIDLIGSGGGSTK
jgi:hypothetical protein